MADLMGIESSPTSLPLARDAEAADLPALIGHSHAIPGTTTVEAAHTAFARHKVDYLVVLDGEQLMGVCARRDLTQLLGSRVGFALNARGPVSQHLMDCELSSARLSSRSSKPRTRRSRVL